MTALQVNAESTDPQVEPLPDEHDQSKPTVLIVDDSRVARSLTALAFRDIDCRIIEAVDGEDGLAKARAYKPDIIITDALMPKLDGRLLCEAVKADPALQNTKVIVVTALYTSSRYKSEARATFKVDAYIPKPINTPELRALVIGFLGVRQISPRLPESSANKLEAMEL